MARIRTIKPEFWGDEKLSLLAPVERLTFVGLISHADDAGRLVDNVKSIDGLLFPNTDDTCRDALDTLARLSRILRYESASGQRLIQIVNWNRHQKVDKPSQYVLPGPTDPGSTQAHADAEVAPEAGEYSRDPSENLASSSRPDLGPSTVDLRSPIQTAHGASGDAPGEEPAFVNGEPYPSDFERAWELYPKRPNNPKKGAYRAWRARIRAKVPAEEMLAGVVRYAAYCVGKGIVGSETVMQAQTFFGPDERWKEEYPVVPRAGAASLPHVDRARTLLRIYRTYGLLSFTAGAKDDNRRKLNLAKADDDAGPDFEAEILRVKPWERPIAEATHERFAIDEIARRLATPAATAAA